MEAIKHLRCETLRTEVDEKISLWMTSDNRMERYMRYERCFRQGGEDAT